MSDCAARYRCIDLFAGIGGIRAGFEVAAQDGELETVFVSEFNDYAVKTYAANFNTPFKPINGLESLRMKGHETVVYGDITRIDDEHLKLIPAFDICFAGFPCQAFSLAGKRMGLEDSYKGMARGTLFQDLIRVCEAKKPKIVFCENVKNLLHHDGGNTFRVIAGAFDDAGYKVYEQVLNSKFFDVPQNRERIYIVAIRKDLDPGSFIFPEGEMTTRTIADILEKDPVDAKYYLSERYLKTLEKHRERHEKKGNGFGYQVKKDGDLASTLSCGGMGRERNLIRDARPHQMGIVGSKHSPINDKDIRCMTPREWARLQGFNDSFILPVADVHLYKQFGNTVTVTVIEAIAREALAVLDRAYEPRKHHARVKQGIIEQLEKGPMTHGELVDDIGSLFISTTSSKKASQQISNCLQELKREGKVAVSGNTSAAIWTLRH